MLVHFQQMIILDTTKEFRLQAIVKESGLSKGWHAICYSKHLHALYGVTLYIVLLCLCQETLKLE